MEGRNLITALVEQGSLIDRTAELLITDENWKILYRNGVLDFSEAQWAKWSMLYQEAPYEFAKVMEKADGMMYEDKRKIKIARGDDPDQR